MHDFQPAQLRYKSGGDLRRGPYRSAEGRRDTPAFVAAATISLNSACTPGPSGLPFRASHTSVKSSAAGASCGSRVRVVACIGRSTGRLIGSSHCLCCYDTLDDAMDLLLCIQDGLRYGLKRCERTRSSVRCLTTVAPLSVAGAIHTHLQWGALPSRHVPYSESSMCRFGGHL